MATMERHFETHQPVELYVENGKGLVEVHATDTTETHVAVTGQDADDVTVTLDGRHLNVLAPKSRGSFMSGDHRLDMTITLPTGSSLVTKLGSADLTTTGSLDQVSVKSGSGDVGIDTITGEARFETGSGDIGIGTAGADVAIKTGSGDVTIQEVAGELAVSTGSGDVKVATTSTSAVVKTGSGDLRVGTSHGDLTLTTGSGDLVVETAVRGRLTMKGASGDVRVGIPAGTPVWTDISTVSGRLNSRIEGAGQPEEGADHVEVRARTVSGDVTLVEA